MQSVVQQIRNRIFCTALQCRFIVTPAKKAILVGLLRALSCYRSVLHYTQSR
jgi:hypothetical protein